MEYGCFRCVEEIELPISAQIAYLQTKYTAEQILAMYEIRQIGTYELIQNQEDIVIKELKNIK